MSYVYLTLPDTKASAAISIATEHLLEQAHHIMAATYPSEGVPSNHFGSSAAVITLLVIAAASAIRHFDPKKNKKPSIPRDSDAFKDCVLQFFPWNNITIDDDQHRSSIDRRMATADELYYVFRNSLVHSGGVTSDARLSGVIGNWYRTPRIAHVFPGLTPVENEKSIEDYCNAALTGDTLIQLEAFSSTIHTRPLYWCTRKMIESLATDPEVQKDITNNLAL